MSATEVIEQIKKLPRKEQEAVYSFLESEHRKFAGEGEAKHATDEDFEKVAEEVFSKHENLFRRLAQ